MLMHLTFLGLSVAPNGYLAVDFFFVLSGYVMSHAYAQRLESMSFSRFVQLRLIRLLPLSLMGLLIGTSYFLARACFLPDSLYTVPDILGGAAFNAFLIPKPWISAPPTDTIFTTDPPLWSLVTGSPAEFRVGRVSLQGKAKDLGDHHAHRRSRNRRVLPL